MPIDLYRFNDNFGLDKSYVLYTMKFKIYLAKLLEDSGYQMIAQFYKFRMSHYKLKKI